MATKKAAKRKTVAEKRDVESALIGLDHKVIALMGQLEEAERQKSIFKDQAAKLEGQLSAAESELKWGQKEFEREKAKLEGTIEGMVRAMKILRRWGQSKRRRGS